MTGVGGEFGPRAVPSEGRIVANLKGLVGHARRKRVKPERALGGGAVCPLLRQRVYGRGFGQGLPKRTMLSLNESGEPGLVNRCRASDVLAAELGGVLGSKPRFLRVRANLVGC